MRYRLIVLTHGSEDTLTEALASFRKHVRPLPTEAFIFADGAEARARAQEVATRYDAWDWDIGGASDPVGFCDATSECWSAAASPHAGVEFVYWLEHDFVHLRDVDLEEVAATLRRFPNLAQIALLRGPANEAERAAGGIVEQRPHLYEQMETWGGAAWVEHHLYWTTNPSLFRREVAAEHPWPTVAAECEGHFGFQLRESWPAVRFAYWGRLGEGPWVDHVGVRSGFGY